MGFKIATVTRSSGPTVLRAVLALAVAAAALGGLALGDPSSSSDRGRGGNALPRHAREAGGTTTRDELAGWSRDELIRRIVHLETQTSAALSTTRAGASVPQRARREASPHVPQETSPGKGWLVFNGCTMSCGGWGDRLRGITQSYLAARLSGRRFAIQATFPVPLTTWIVPHPALEHPWDVLPEKDSYKGSTSYNGQDGALHQEDYASLVENVKSRVVQLRVNVENTDKLMRLPEWEPRAPCEVKYRIGQLLAKAYAANRSWPALANEYLNIDKLGCTYNGCGVATQHVYRNVLRLKPELQRIADHFLALNKGHKMVCLQARFGGGQKRATNVAVPGQTNSMHSDLHRMADTGSTAEGMIAWMASQSTAHGGAPVYLFTDSMRFEHAAIEALGRANTTLITPLHNVPTIHLDKATAADALKYGYKTFVHFELMTHCDVFHTTSPFGGMARAVGGGVA